MLFAPYQQAIDAHYHRVGRDSPFRKPAPARDLRRVESALGQSLPKELCAAWLASNGSGTYSPVFARPGFLTGYDFFPVAKAIQQRQAMSARAKQYRGYVEPAPRDPRIRPGWFHDGWLPFAGFGGSTLLLLIDLSPAATGSHGQVIAFTHDPDEIGFVAESFPVFLTLSAQAFEEDGEDLLGE